MVNPAGKLEYSEYIRYTLGNIELAELLQPPEYDNI